MSYTIVGLGNPGAEYENTRHNTGRLALLVFAKAHNFPEFAPDKKTKALISEGKVGKEKVLLMEPETFMNKSGVSVLPLIKSKKAAEHLVVIHDDLDIPFGTFKISFNKSSGGHRGVESIIKAVKTESFVRIRVGISPANAKGVAKKPKGEEAVNKFILAKFKPAELDEFKKVFKRIAAALTAVVTEGREKAMSQQGSF